jgi:hypothetical protein
VLAAASSRTSAEEPGAAAAPAEWRPGSSDGNGINPAAAGQSRDAPKFALLRDDIAPEGNHVTAGERRYRDAVAAVADSVFRREAM